MKTQSANGASSRSWPMSFRIYLVLLYAISLPLFIASLFVPGRWASSLQMVGGLITSGQSPNDVFALGALFLCAAQVFFAISFHGAWKKAIQKGNSAGMPPSIPSARRAIGFAFIPLFNLYWIFRAFGCLLLDMDRLAAKANTTLRPPVWLGFVMPLLLIAAFIPAVSSVAFLLGVFAFFPSYLAIALFFCSKGNAGELAIQRGPSALNSLISGPGLARIIRPGIGLLIALVLSAVSYRWWTLLSRNQTFNGMSISDTIRFGWLYAVLLGPLLKAGCLILFAAVIRRDWIIPFAMGIAAVAITALGHLTSAVISISPASLALAFLGGFLLMLCLLLPLHIGGFRLGAFSLWSLLLLVIPLVNVAFRHAAVFQTIDGLAITLVLGFLAFSSLLPNAIKTTGSSKTIPSDSP